MPRSSDEGLSPPLDEVAGLQKMAKAAERVDDYDGFRCACIQSLAVDQGSGSMANRSAFVMCLCDYSAMDMALAVLSEADVWGLISQTVRKRRVSSSIDKCFNTIKIRRKYYDNYHFVPRADLNCTKGGYRGRQIETLHINVTNLQKRQPRSRRSKSYLHKYPQILPPCLITRFDNLLRNKRALLCNLERKLLHWNGAQDIKDADLALELFENPVSHFNRH